MVNVYALLRNKLTNERSERSCLSFTLNLCNNFVALQLLTVQLFFESMYVCHTSVTITSPNLSFFKLVFPVHVWCAHQHYKKRNRQKSSFSELHKNLLIVVCLF